MLPTRVTGRRVVLLHGFTQTGASWDAIARDLAGRGFETIAPDLPGHGRAARVEANLWASADLAAEAGGPAAYVGYSLGGRVALHVALAHPATVTGLVLVSATAGIDDADERAVRRASDNAMAAELESAGDAGLGAFLDRWLAGPLFATLPAHAAGLQVRLTNTAAGLASSLRQAGTGTQEPLWGRLGELRMPVLVVAGSLDPKFVAAAERLAAAIGPNATLRVVDGAGHAVPLEQPEQFADLVADFVGGAGG